ncbi:hypothetical protein DW949_10165 [Megasphaera sp. AM44-1BH]|nr:hypothetical protein DW949_10165 [Megasphaera sp. AM44-1BH]
MRHPPFALYYNRNCFRIGKDWTQWRKMSDWIRKKGIERVDNWQKSCIMYIILIVIITRHKGDFVWQLW